MNIHEHTVKNYVDIWMMYTTD